MRSRLVQKFLTVTLITVVVISAHPAVATGESTIGDGLTFGVTEPSGSSNGILAEHRQQTPQYGWQSDFVGPGLPLGQVLALTTFQNELIIGGRFVFADDKLVNNIARWNGTQWQALEDPNGSGVEFKPSGESWTEVRAMQVFQGKLVVSGSFTRAGGMPADGLAVWDGMQWSAFEDNHGAQFNGPISRMTEYNGELIVTGFFTMVDDLVVNGIARWDGAHWRTLAGPNGTGFQAGAVKAMTEHEGNLVVGGSISEVGGVEVDQIALWDGATWSSLEVGASQGIETGWVSTLATYNGELIAGGGFEYIGDTYVSNIARWDGTEWHAMSGPGEPHWPDYDVGVVEHPEAMIMHDGKLIVGGSLLRAGGLPIIGVAAWDGNQWSALDTPEQQVFGQAVTVNSLAIHNESLIAGGAFSRLGDQWSRNIARWNSDHWTALESTHDFGIQNKDAPQLAGPLVQSIFSHGEYLYVGGRFTNTGKKESHNIARWNGSSWIEMPGINEHAYGEVKTMANFEGDLVAGGRFQQAGTTETSSIARWDGDQWHALNDQAGNGLGPSSGRVNSLAIFQDELIVAGSFSTAGGATANSIARWNGQQWLSLTGPNGTGITSSHSMVEALAVVDGELFVGGSFREAGGIEAIGIARWNGEEWLRAGPEVVAPDHSSIRAMVIYDGQLHASGSFWSDGELKIDGIARWAGHEWLPLESQPDDSMSVRPIAMHVHENKLVVSGVSSQLTGPVFNSVAAWDGQNWSAFSGPRLTGFAYANHELPSALATHNGELFIGGAFMGAGGAPAWGLSRYLENPVQVKINSFDPDFSDPGQAVTITVSVTGSNGLPEQGLGLINSTTGHSCLTEEMTPIDSHTLVFSCDISFEESGLHELTAYYESPTDNHGGLSQPIVHGVKSHSTTTGNLSPSTSQYAGQMIFFTGQVSGPFEPIGTMVIDVDGREICEAEHSEFGFQCTSTIHEIGERLVTFTYSGNDLLYPSSQSKIYTITDPLLELSPGHLDFGVVDAGTEAPSKSLTLTNRSDTDIDIAGISSAQAPFPAHPESDCPAPPFTLHPGSSCQLVYAFEPETNGEFSRRITVFTNPPPNWYFFFLSGTGRDELMHDRFELQH